MNYCILGEKVLTKGDNPLDPPQFCRALLVISGTKIAQVFRIPTDGRSVLKILEDLCFPQLYYFEEEYLIPGLIDINVKFNGDWEGCASTTQKALEAGVTTIAYEDNSFGFKEDLATKFTDVCQIKPVYEPKDVAKAVADGAVAVKAYNLPQSPSSKATDLEEVLQELKDTNLGLVVDCSITSERFLQTVLPYRVGGFGAEPPLNSVFVTAIDKSSAGSSDSEPNSPLEQKDIFALCEAEKQSYRFQESSFVNYFKKSTFEGPALKRLELLRPPKISTETPKLDETLYSSYLLNCPSSWELRGAKLTVQKLKGSKVKVLFANISCPETIELVKGLKLLTQTCPHYLLLEDSEVPSGDSRFKTFPPIRSRENRLRLLKQLGKTEIVSSHHNPVPGCYKTREFRKSLEGISSVGVGFQKLCTHLVKEWGWEEGLRIAVKKMSTAPAKFIGLDSLKGSIAKGKHADITVINPNCHSEGWGIYKGHKLLGSVSKVFLRGELVLDHQATLARGKLITKG